MPRGRGGDSPDCAVLDVRVWDALFLARRLGPAVKFGNGPAKKAASGPAQICQFY